MEELNQKEITPLSPKNASSQSTSSCSSLSEKEIKITPSPLSLTTKDILYFISGNIINKIYRNKKLYPNISMNTNHILYSDKIPLIGIEKYLERFLKYSNVEDSTLIAMLIYIKRYISKKKLIISNNNIYKLILGCAVLAIKYNEKNMYKNERYAQIGGIELQELNEIEFYLFKSLGFKLHVFDYEYEAVVQKILNEKA